MKTVISTYVLVTVAWLAQSTFGYDITTHRAMSEKAFAQADVRDYLREALSLSPDEEFEGTSPFLGSSVKPLIRWISDGAQDEDDTVALSLNPNSWTRYVNHSYNPLNESGLDFRGVTGLPAPTWGIELSSISGQDFSFTDARGYFLNALTAPDPKDREHALARTFLTLGHVIHLIEDAAQPQHTRNDSHGPGPFGGRSLYEKYTEQHTACLPLDGYAPVYGGADSSAFSFVWDYWHQVDGKGLADYSNRGFVTARSNFTALPQGQPLNEYAIFPHAGFPFPNGQDASVHSAQIQDLGNTACGVRPPTGLVGEIDFVNTPVPDAYRPEPPERNDFTTTYSIFDPDLENDHQPLTFTLNRYNFEAAWQFLIPRAVGYSAGLLNYFFRGGLECARDPETPGNYVIKNVGPDDLNGDFTLYAEDQYGTRQEVTPAAGWSQRQVRGGAVPVGGRG